MLGWCLTLSLALPGVATCVGSVPARDGAVVLRLEETSLGQVLSEVARLLIEEQLGYRATVSNCTSCAWDVALDLRGDKEGEDLGSLGLLSNQFLWIKESIRREAAGQGLFLDHFRSYATNVSRFFDPLEALEAVQLVNCSALDAGRYAVESGDSFGVEGDRPRCEHWWPAPQGRGGCIPLLARDHFEDVMMLAWRHELPVCVAQAASLEAFQDFIRTKRVLFYWWSDATFAELDPQEVFLPFKALPSYGRKRVNAALQARLPLVRALVSRISLAEAPDFPANLSAPEAACHWLQSTDLWREWIPSTDTICPSGTTWHQGRCVDCPRGLQCVENFTPLLLPGFFAPHSDPLAVRECASSRCPGGAPGTCGAKLDNSTACTKCLEGYMASDVGPCTACTGTGFVTAILFIVLFLVTGSVHFMFLMAASRRSTSTSLLHAEIGCCEFLTFAQLIDVIRRLGLWSESLVNLWAMLCVFRPDAWEYIAEPQCFFRPTPVLRYSLRTLAMPVCFIVIPCLYHLVFLARWRELQLWVLGRTIGTIFVVFFIALCAALTLPFRCQLHPSGIETLEAYPEVLCDWKGEHLRLVLVCLAAALFPTSFLALCFWMMRHFKRRLSAGVYLRSCAFLCLRLKPHQPNFALFLLCRNGLLALCPLLPWGRAATMQVLLHLSLVLTVLNKPWRARGSNFIDILMHLGVLFILVFMEESESAQSGQGKMLLIMLAVILVVTAFAVTIIYGLVKFFRVRRRKTFDFFICHDKSGTGSLARLLKMELRRRVHSLQVFVDSDQLADLTQPLSIVGYEVKSVILLGSKKVLKQKWCVAEIVVARLEGVRTVLVTTPDFRMPDATFVTNYMTSVPGIGELASYGIGYREIKDTILWVCKLEELPLVRLEPEALNCVVDGLSGCHGPKIPLLEACEVAILADPKNMAASATAYVLRAMLDPEVFKIGLGSCSVLSQQLLPKEPIALLFLCSEGCFDSEQVISWLLQACEVPECFVFPILIGDHFEFPSSCFYQDLFKESSSGDDQQFAQAFIEAVFLEVPGLFLPTRVTGIELEWQAKHLLQRVNDRAKRTRMTISRLQSFGGEAGAALMKQASILGRLASFLLPGNNREEDEAERSSHRISGRSSGRSSGYSQNSDKISGHSCEANSAEGSDVSEEYHF